jgi:hypothetical protein
VALPPSCAVPAGTYQYFYYFALSQPGCFSLLRSAVQQKLPTVPRLYEQRPGYLANELLLFAFLFAIASILEGQ